MIVVFLVVALLLVVNALCVGAEFAVVGVRRHRVQRRAEEGSLPAQVLAPIVSRPRRLNRAISACQLGITASSLVLGAFAQRTLAGLLGGFVEGLAGMGTVAAETASFVIVLTVITAVQVVLTEQVPKSVVLRDPLRWSLTLALPLRWIELLLAGFVVLLQGSANAVLRILGVSTRDRSSLHSPAEIGLIVSESARVGMVRKDLRDGIHNALRFTTRTARDVMVPRVQVRGVPVDVGLEELRRVQRESSHTRLPVYRGSLDDIVGTVHVKDVLLRTTGAEAPPDPADLYRPVLAVPWSAGAGDLLERMREARVTMAVVLDEHGGTAGIVTLEDLMGAIIGDVADEFDRRGRLPERLPDGRLRLRGETPLIDVNDRHGLALPSREAHTVGGLVMEALGRVARTGDVVRVGGVRLEVERMTGHRVETVLATPRGSSLAGPGSSG